MLLLQEGTCLRYISKVPIDTAPLFDNVHLHHNVDGKCRWQKMNVMITGKWNKTPHLSALKYQATQLPPFDNVYLDHNMDRKSRWQKIGVGQGHADVQQFPAESQLGCTHTHKKVKVLNQNGTIMDFLFPKKVLNCFGAAYKKIHKNQSKSCIRMAP